MDKSHNDPFDLLSENYEVWLRLPSTEIISEAMEDYIIQVQAANAADDGYPMGIRRVDKAIVIKRDIEAEPFGIQAYRFSKKYLTRPGLFSHLAKMALGAMIRLSQSRSVIKLFFWHHHFCHSINGSKIFHSFWGCVTKVACFPSYAVSIYLHSPSLFH